MSNYRVESDYNALGTTADKNITSKSYSFVVCKKNCFPDYLYTTYVPITILQ